MSGVWFRGVWVVWAWVGLRPLVSACPVVPRVGPGGAVWVGAQAAMGGSLPVVWSHRVMNSCCQGQWVG